MPTYQYACTECGHAFDEVQSFSDDALTVCPECTGRLRKVFNAVGVVFKGSGFYRTDSRAKDSAGSKETAGVSASSTPSSDSGSSTKSTSTSDSATKTPAAAGSSSKSSSSSPSSSGSGSSD